MIDRQSQHCPSIIATKMLFCEEKYGGITVTNVKTLTSLLPIYFRQGSEVIRNSYGILLALKIWNILLECRKLNNL